MAEEAARELGLHHLALDVAGAFHSPRMEPAVEPFRAALDEAELHEAVLHRLLVAGPRSRSMTCATSWTKVLTRPVRWRETVVAMHEAGGRRFVEVGPGKVLARLDVRILPDCKVETPAEEEADA